ncbi:malto-oligosyltrehalose trehalohydrolase, partial [Pseudomonas aeruginosa]|nr:malto-oligosyltrehalose trehalohydrolase [Pseudomonas aeruginosa]
INFLQNHDQIGNRPLGERLDSIAKPQAIEAGLAVTLLAPTTPMLFMGEEWGATTPFPFFCDFTGDLANAVRAGRRKEFAWAYAKYGDDV